jgi:bifunctional non-homologous end joining protein LigD
VAREPLSVYQQKRDFSKTAEPRATTVAPSARLRFVIQKHAARRLHYDLRLEWDGVFKSWAVTRGPSLDPADKRLAVQVEDHPLDYGDFEGTIPQGQYGGGTVQLWDRGFWTPEGGKSPEEALKHGELKFTLDGVRLHGSWVLVRLKQDRYQSKRTNWLLIKHRDAAARPGGTQALMELDRSVASGRSMEQIARGKGRSPKPFMLAGPARARPDAVWHSRHEPTQGGQNAATDLPRAASGKPAAVKPLLVKAMPRFVEPQLCTLVERPPAQPGWAHEIKFDGYRAQLRVSNGTAAVYTRRGLDWTGKFAAIAKAAKGLPDCLIDGEIVALDAQRLPDFAALQAALSEGASENLIFFAFDLLFEGREDLRRLALVERKRRLEKLLSGVDTGERVRFVQHIEASADTVLQSACKMHLEGIISKRLDAPYVAGRAGFWTKAKCRGGQEVVLGGWTMEAGRFRSLLAGVYHKGQLLYVGRIGTGYGGKVAAQLVPKLKALTRAQSPFVGENAPRKEPDVRWLEPALVAEIEFAGWTGSGMIRQASFKGLREDKSAREVVAETPIAVGSGAAMPDKKLKAMVSRGPARSTKAPMGRKNARAVAPKVARSGGSLTVMGVSISNPDKALWPDARDHTPVTKLDLARYYEGIGDWMLPHVAGRPCSLVRVPDGLGRQQFFQRHAMAGMSGLFSLVKIRGDKAPYVQIDRVEALVAAAQLGALEIHPWNCVPGDPEAVGRLVFDLDPAPDLKFDAVIAGALEVRDRLKAVGLESFCKTTGGKGLHVVAPLTSKDAVTWPVAKNFAHIISAQMAQDSPSRYVENMAKIQRTGKICLDYLRNDRTATAVAVLSPRARAGASVSMPVDWNAVRRGLDPMQYTVRSAPALLRKSTAWDGYEKAARSLAAAIRTITRAAPSKKRRA